MYCTCPCLNPYNIDSICNRNPETYLSQFHIILNKILHYCLSQTSLIFHILRKLNTHFYLVVFCLTKRNQYIVWFGWETLWWVHNSTRNLNLHNSNLISAPIYIMFHYNDHWSCQNIPPCLGYKITWKAYIVSVHVEEYTIWWSLLYMPHTLELKMAYTIIALQNFHHYLSILGLFKKKYGVKSKLS